MLAAGGYALRRLGQRLDPDRHWWVAPLLDARMAALAIGALVGAILPGHLGDPLDQATGMAIVFLSGWLGLTAGCGLDLRVLRRHAAAPLLYEAAQAPALLVVLAVVVFAATRAFEAASGLFGATGVFLLAGLCAAGDPLPTGRTSRKTSGPKHGFWRPRSSAMAAIALVAVGLAFAPAVSCAIRLPWSGSLQPVLFESVGLRLWWGLFLGGVAGLLCDLVTKDGFALGGLHYLLAGVVLLCSGLAAALGLSPLLVGAVAGLWLINATLRRMDVVHVLDRAQVVPRLTVPLLVGWCLARGLPEAAAAGPDWAAFAVSGIALVGLRPLAKMWEQGRYAAQPAPARRAQGGGGLAARLEVGDLSLLVALLLSQLGPPSTGWAALAAVGIGQLVLGLAAARLERTPPVGAL